MIVREIHIDQRGSQYRLTLPLPAMREKTLDASAAKFRARCNLALTEQVVLKNDNCRPRGCYVASVRQVRRRNLNLTGH